MKILVTIDESDYAMKIANYMAAAVNPAVQITLFSVLPTFSLTMERQLPRPQPAEKVGEPKEMMYNEKKLTEEMMEKCRAVLTDSGIPGENIETKIVHKKIGVAQDIIMEVEKGNYNTVVVGRRGLSAIAAFVFGSISNKIVHNIKNCTVWVVD